jgi:LysR family hydrogen peroxide-inducible transcriptional activator
VALAEARHFRKAAERAGVSQPTLSAQLAALEERLGVQLIERSRSSVLVTPIGQKVLDVSRRLLRDAQEIRELAASHRGEFGGVIRLGLPPTIGPYLLPRVLPDLHRTHPRFKIYIREQAPSRLPDALADGAHDVIVTPLPLPNADFACTPIFREPLYIVMPEDHPLAQKPAIERSDLGGLAILALERGHQLHEQVEAICEEFGARMLFDYEGTSLETLREMTALGMGVSFLPGLFVTTALGPRSGVVARELKGRSLYRTIGMAWRRTSARDAEFRLLLGFIRKAIERDFDAFARL